MPWSKSYLPKELAETRVLEFVPHKIDLGTPESAKKYVERKQSTDFRMNEQVQIHTGVDQIEKATDEEKSERRALEMMAEMQQNAYKEAYELGLEDGRKNAFEKHALSIEGQLQELEQLLQSIGKLKDEMALHNEAHLVKLMFHMASRLAMKEFEADNKLIIEVIRSSVALAQEEEEVRIQLNPTQFEFIENIKKQTNRETEFLKKLKVEPHDEIKVGGCVVETNYGEIDSRMETRISQVWESIVDAIPRVKDRISE